MEHQFMLSDNMALMIVADDRYVSIYLRNVHPETKEAYGYSFKMILPQYNILESNVNLIQNTFIHGGKCGLNLGYKMQVDCDGERLEFTNNFIGLKWFWTKEQFLRWVTCIPEIRKVISKEYENISAKFPSTTLKRQNDEDVTVSGKKAVGVIKNYEDTLGNKETKRIYDIEIPATDISWLFGEKDVGDGWWEGVNELGQRGLFPESYVEVLNETDELSNNGPPPVAPPPLPEQFRQSTSLQSHHLQSQYASAYDRRDSWNESITPAAVSQAPQPAQDFDDDWSDDDEDYQAGDHSTLTRRSKADVRDEVPSHASVEHQQHLGSSSDHLHHHHQQEQQQQHHLLDTDQCCRHKVAGGGGSSSSRSSIVLKTEESDETTTRATPELLDSSLEVKTEPMVLPSQINKPVMTLNSKNSKNGHNQAVVTSALTVDSQGVVRNRNRNESNTGSVKRNMNRFSPFVKSGTENYLLNSTKLSSKPSETIEVVATKDGFQWSPSDAYSCKISSHTKSSKLHGLKSFICYQLTPSINNLQVSRRYKHFDWLLNRLQEKFTIVFVPPLPEKQVTGRYEDEFVEHRMHLLQMWLDIICKHPVLSKSDVWMHFLTCTDEKEWKKGKRKAEKDEFSGGSLFYTIKIPPNPILDYLDVERQIDTFFRSCRGLEEGVRNFQSVTHNHAKRMTGPFKAEFAKIANAFRILGGSFDAVEQSNATVRQLSSALAKTGLCYESISKSYDEQPKYDCTPLLNELFIYKGMLNNVPDVLQVHKSACNKYRESQRMAEEGRVTGQELDQIRSRLDTISCATLAEINHFQKERLSDFNRMMKNFLNGQIAFYEGVVEKLRDAASKFE